MPIKRKDFIRLSGLTTATSLFTGFRLFAGGDQKDIQDFSKRLSPITDDVVSITLAERKDRIAKAQRLLASHQMDALLLDAGTTMNYFTGLSWGQSERTMVAIIPAKGEVKYVCPAFEEPRLRERITLGKDIYVWQEDESPYRIIARVLKEAGIAHRNIGIEEETRFFIVNGLKKEAPELNLLSGDPITIPCRMIKSLAEIKLMQKANDITLAAIKHSVSALREGMSQQELSAMIMKAQNALGGRADFALCLFGNSSAFPHGSRNPSLLKKGDIVLMDCGCTVEGYNADITRTIVFGAPPTKRQREIWQLEKDAQEAGFAAAQIGTSCEAVDTAARNVLIKAGLGPGYQLPGLPHRTGHGIGMEGHEWGNMVKGNTKLLEAGMCFSIEPTIAIPGEFGVRLEDCVYMTATGPKWFSAPSPSIDEPFA